MAKVDAERNEGLIEFPEQALPDMFASGEEDTSRKDRGHGEGRVIEIPQVQGNFTIAPGWHVTSSEAAMGSLGLVDFPSEEARKEAVESCEEIGRTSVLATRYREPFDGYNPSLLISWHPLPPAFPSLSEGDKNEMLSRIIMKAVVPSIQRHDRRFRLLEKPRPLQGGGSGVGVTFRHGISMKSGKQFDGVVRMYLTHARNHLLSISLATPGSQREAEEVVSDLWAMFESIEVSR